MSYQEIERRASQKKHERTVGELNAQIEHLLKELRQMHELTVRMVKYHGLDNETGPICGGPKDGR